MTDKPYSLASIATSVIRRDDPDATLRERYARITNDAAHMQVPYASPAELLTPPSEPLDQHQWPATLDLALAADDLPNTREIADAQLVWSRVDAVVRKSLAATARAIEALILWHDFCATWTRIAEAYRTDTASIARLARAMAYLTSTRPK